MEGERRERLKEGLKIKIDAPDCTSLTLGAWRDYSKCRHTQTHTHAQCLKNKGEGDILC